MPLSLCTASVQRLPKRSVGSHRLDGVHSTKLARGSPACVQASSSKPTMQQPSRVKPVVSSAAQLRGLMMKGTGWDNPEFKALFGKSPWKSRWHMLAFDLGHVGLFIIPLLLCVKLWCK